MADVSQNDQLCGFGGTGNDKLRGKDEDTRDVPSSPSPKPQIDRVLFIMRGLPGSGKSTVATTLAEHTPNGSAVILSTDDYFINPTTGKYVFNGQRLNEAHAWNLRRVAKALFVDKPLAVIVDNTHTKRWEASMAVRLALAAGVTHVEVVEPITPWRFNPSELVWRTIHGVPRAKIAQMLLHWESAKVFGTTANDILKGEHLMPPFARPQLKLVDELIKEHTTGGETTV